jgi:phosphate starvation-inducible PhoH-like protein
LTFVHFDETDVVRHHLVQRIIRAYDEHRTHVAEQQMLLLSGGKSVEVKNSAVQNAGDRSREASGE